MNCNLDSASFVDLDFEMSPISLRAPDRELLTAVDRVENLPDFFNLCVLIPVFTFCTYLRISEFHVQVSFSCENMFLHQNTGSIIFSSFSGVSSKSNRNYCLKTCVRMFVIK